MLGLPPVPAHPGGLPGCGAASARSWFYRAWYLLGAGQRFSDQQDPLPDSAGRILGPCGADFSIGHVVDRYTRFFLPWVMRDVVHGLPLGTVRNQEKLITLSCYQFSE
jgi:hypothetical protein